MEKITKISKLICDKISLLAMGTTFFLMCMITVHAVLRKVASIPGLQDMPLRGIPGNIELTEVGLVVIVFCSVAYLQSVDGHIRVDMLINALPKRLGNTIQFVILILSAAIVFVMFYAAVLSVPSLFNSGQGTMILSIPIWPFNVIMCIGLLMYAITLLISGINRLILAIKGEPAEEAVA